MHAPLPRYWHPAVPVDPPTPWLLPDGVRALVFYTDRDPSIREVGYSRDLDFNVEAYQVVAREDMHSRVNRPPDRCWSVTPPNDDTRIQVRHECDDDVYLIGTYGYHAQESDGASHWALESDVLSVQPATVVEFTLADWDAWLDDPAPRDAGPITMVQFFNARLLARAPTPDVWARVQSVLWYAAHVMDDKPHQFWRQLELLANELGDTEAEQECRRLWETPRNHQSRMTT